jgi:Tol biopolymer transport system component
MMRGPTVLAAVLACALAGANADAAEAGTTARVSVDSAGAQVTGPSEGTAISASGRYVAFASLANDLVAGDTNGWWDIFLRDRLARRTERISVSTSGAQANADSFAPSISADGRYVAFVSTATNLAGGDTDGVVDVVVRDRVAHTTVRVSVSARFAWTAGGRDRRRAALPRWKR